MSARTGTEGGENERREDLNARMRTVLKWPTTLYVTADVAPMSKKMDMLTNTASTALPSTQNTDSCARRHARTVASIRRTHGHAGEHTGHTQW